MFRGIRKLMPGHHLTLDLSASNVEPKSRATGTFRRRRLAQPLDRRAWIAESRRRLEETVRMRLMSDVPLGMFLSGGVDSSAIAALIKQSTGGAVKTFAVGYRETQFSELTYAARLRGPSAPSTTKSPSASTISSTPCRA